MKKIITIGLSAAMLISTLTINFADTNFKDLENHWSKSNVEELVSKGIIDGYEDGTFKPDNEITVAEFMKIIMINNQIPLGDKGLNWYDQYINGARNIGLIQGGEFTNYNKAISRVEMVKIIDRALNLESAGDINYKDYKDFASNAMAIYKVSTAKIINGFPDGKFMPFNNSTRGEVSTVIKRINDYIGEDIILPNVKIIPEYNADGSWTDDWYMENLSLLRSFTNYSNDKTTYGNYYFEDGKINVDTDDLNKVDRTIMQDEKQNEKIYKILKYLTQRAYETNKYVRVVHYSNMNGIDGVISIDFSPEHMILDRGYFAIDFPLNPNDYIANRYELNIDAWKIQRVDVIWDIGKMFDEESFPSNINYLNGVERGEYLEKYDYVLEPYGEVAENTAKIIYGDYYKEIYDYMIKERLKEIKLGSYENYNQIEINGIKIYNANDMIAKELFLSEIK